MLAAYSCPAARCNVALKVLGEWYPAADAYRKRRTRTTIDSTAATLAIPEHQASAAVLLPAALLLLLYTAGCNTRTEAMETETREYPQNLSGIRANVVLHW